MSILIQANRGNKHEVVDEADNRREAKGKVDYWKQMKGKGWRITTRVIK